MNTRRVVLVLIGVLVAGVIAWMVTRQHQTTRTPDQLTIGVILPQTGILGQMGQVERRAMELAAEDLRSSGFSVRLVFEDGKGENNAVAAAANKLFDIDGVDVLITSTTGASLTAQPIAERHNKTLLAFCTSSDLAPKSPSTIRFYIGIEEETEALLDQLRRLPRDTKVGVLHANVALWATTVANTYQPFLKQQFSSPSIIEQYDLKTKDFRPQLTRFKNSGVGVLVILGYGFEYGPLFTQMAELQMRDSLQILGGWGFLYTEVEASQLEGICVAGPTYVFRRGQPGAVFEQRYRTKYGAAPNFDAAFAYEVIRQLPEMRKIDSALAPGKLKPGLVGRGEVQGVMGRYHFTAQGNMIVDTGIGKFRNGVLQGE